MLRCTIWAISSFFLSSTFLPTSHPLSLPLSLPLSFPPSLLPSFPQVWGQHPCGLAHFFNCIWPTSLQSTMLCTLWWSCHTPLHVVKCKYALIQLENSVPSPTKVRKCMLILYSILVLWWSNQLHLLQARYLATINNLWYITHNNVHTYVCCDTNYNTLWHTHIPHAPNFQVTIKFRNNTAILGSALLVSRLSMCSWFSFAPPYFNNTSILDWPIWDFGWVVV